MRWPRRKYCLTERSGMEPGDTLAFEGQIGEKEPGESRKGRETRE